MSVKIYFVFIISNLLLLPTLDVSKISITLKVKGSGLQYILNPKFNESGGIFPDEVLLNGNPQIKGIYSVNPLAEESNISLFWNNKLDSLNDMFRDCINITEIDLSKFDTSIVTRMSAMFYNCKSLKKVDFSNFNSSLMIGMGSSFYNCSSLEYLNLSNFDTSNNNHFNDMFYNCYSLKYLNISNFNTSKASSMNRMFYNCSSLKFIDLNNLTKIPIYRADNILFGCHNLKYLNIKNYVENQDIQYNDLFQDILSNSNFTICYNESINSKLKAYINSTEIFSSFCYENFFIDNMDYSNTKIETNIITEYIINATSNLNISFTNSIYLINCEPSQVCNISDLFPQYKEMGNLSELLLDEIKKGNVQQILKEKNNIILQENNDVHQIAKYSFQKNNLNYTSIDLKDCEDLLNNNKDNNSELFIYIIEHHYDWIKIPIIDYFLFTDENSYDNNTLLDLSLCNKNKVQYLVPVSINEEDIEKYDPSSKFYNDECNQYFSEDGVDMTLYERKNMFNEKNLSLCEKDCEFIKYNISISKAECEKKKKKGTSITQNDINNDDLVGKISNEKNNLNLKITQCYNILSGTENIKKNSGFYLLLFILIIFIIVFIIFCVKGKNLLEHKIDNVIYILFKKNDNSNDKIKRNILSKKNLIKKSSIKSNKINKNKIKNNIHNKSTEGDSKFHFKSVHYNNNNILNLTKNHKNKNISKLNDYELNILSYKEALNYDKRTCCEYYCVLIKNKQLFFFAFCTFDDYNSGIIKKFIFFLSLALHYTINALFFTDSNMHKIYLDSGAFNFSYQYPKILLSSLISTVILRIILETLVLTERGVAKLKKQKNYKAALDMKNSLMRNINIKFGIFFVVNFILLIFFWYYLTCFNAVYNNTQIYLIENTGISFCISLFFSVVYNIIPTIFRLSSLSSKNSECLYKVSKYFQVI